MRTSALILVLLTLLLSACASGGGSSDGAVTDGGGEIDPNSDADTLEQQAYEVTGDVRVFWYVKSALLPGAGGRDVEQKEQRSTLINRNHSFYRGMPESQMRDEERFLMNADMYDLLIALKAIGFFDKGSAVNVLSDEPIERADREPQTSRIIAVQQIKDGKVNTSYFARRIGESELDPDRAKIFNQCQAVVMQAIAGSLPRGNADYGEGDVDEIRRPR
ncbi:MAG: hypothetical protein KDB32_12795 [Planctomycetes bacterium]|nr:hypothetical protein [Planctomycetota bacterium]